MKRNYEVIGKILYDYNPELAELIEDISKEKVSDLEMLPEIVDSILEIMDMDKSEIMVNKNSDCPIEMRRKSMKARHIIVAVILKLYDPKRMFLKSRKSTYGLTKALSEELKTSKPNISKHSGNVNFFYQHYHDFKIEVNYIYSMILDKYNL